MVHALEAVHRLVAPGGALIDIHPLSNYPPVLVNGQQVGVLKETDDFVEYHQANAALDDVIRRGLFVVERTSPFAALTHADSLPDLLAFLAEEWSDAVLEDDLKQRIEALMPGDIVIQDSASMTLLRRIP